MSELLLSDKEIDRAWSDAFDKPAYFVRKPTAEDLLMIRLRAVAQAQLDKCIKYYEIKK